MNDEEMQTSEVQDQNDTVAGMADQGSEDDPIAVLKKERDEYLAGWRRAKADYDNLVKDAQRSKDAYVKYANEEALIRLLPAIDQYEVALSFAPKLDSIPADARRSFENWITGLEAVRSLWIEAAKELGLEKVRASGPFDPSLHDAVGEEAADAVPSGNIVRATVNGWILNGKVIRAAKVVVSAPQGRESSDT